MPGLAQNIGQTTPKTGTLQDIEHRIDGIPLIIPSAAGVSSCPNNRIVTIQENAAFQRFAVLSPVAYSDSFETYIIIRWGVLEYALQSGGVNSIAPTPATFVDGDLVTVLCGVGVTFMVDNDPSNAPTRGIGTGYVDQQGRLTSVTSGGNVHLAGTVFKSVTGLQLTNQLKTNSFFYQMKDAVTP